MFSDLECDYINPIDLCNKLNQVRLPSCIYLITLLILGYNSLYSRKTVLMLSSRRFSCYLANGWPSCSTPRCLPITSTSTSWSLDACSVHLLISLLSSQSKEQRAHVRRDGDLPHAIWAQKGVVHQTRFLSPLVLLLPLSVRASLCQVIYQNGHD